MTWRISSLSDSFLTTWAVIILLSMGIGGCSHRPKPEPLTPPEPVRIKDDIAASSADSTSTAVTGQGPHQEWQQYKGDAAYRLGKPYKVNGIWYFPAENMKYDEIGFASWYGDKFHNRLTANGEIFDKNGLSAAHKTLPLPSIVRVTNLDNNKNVIVRVNDRGPFANDRPIDLSERAAQALGCPSTGTLKVRVEILPDESLAVANQLRDHTPPEPPHALAPPSAPVSENGPEMSPLTEQAPSAEASGTATDLFDGGPSDPHTIQVVPAPVESPPREPDTSAAPPAVAEPAPQATPPASTHSFIVQVGTFKQQQNASTLSQKLAIVGPTSITPLARNGETLYRVQSGPYADKIQAQNALHHAKSLGIHDAKIVEKST